MAVDVVIVESIPRGGVIVLSGVAEKDREQVKADLYAAAGHDAMGVVFTDPTGEKPAELFTTDRMAEVFKASMAGQVRDDLIAAARGEATTIASQAVAAVVGQPSKPVRRDAPTGT